MSERLHIKLERLLCNLQLQQKENVISELVELSRDVLSGHGKNTNSHLLQNLLHQLGLLHAHLKTGVVLLQK